MLNSLFAYRNTRLNVDLNTCGQAAIATLLDFHGLDPWGLPRGPNGHWDSGAAIDAVKADGFGPDIVFGLGSSGGLIAKALRHYGLIARSRGLFFDGGWEAGWPELRNMLDRELPVPVLLDLGRLRGDDFLFHWAIAYGYDADTVHLAAVTPSRPTIGQFRDAWRSDFIFIPADMKWGAVLSLRPSSRPPAQGDRLQPGERLAADGMLTSPNGKYTLRYQHDGNLVLYRNMDGRALWDTRPRGRGTGHVVMQSDGNLVMYDSSVTPAVWSSDTYGSSGSILVVQDDGNVVIYRADGTAAWATHTVQPNLPAGPQAVGDNMQPGEALAPGTSLISADGRFALVYQGDGNLVVYRVRDGAPLWASNTGGTAPGVTIMQGDGNMVVYDAHATAVFSTGTHGQDGNRLAVQSDGNVVLYRTDGSATWATNSVAWSAVPYSLVQTPDGDHIETFVEHGQVAGDVVEFVLTLGGTVTWRKSMNMPDGEGNSWNLLAEGHGGTARNSLWAHQVTNGQRLTFSKAKFLGVMTVVYGLGDLSNLVGGDRVTFKWIKD